MDDSYTFAEFSRAFDLSCKEVRHLIESGELEVVGDNGHKSIPVSEVIRWCIRDEGEELPPMAFRNVWCPAYDQCLSAHADKEDVTQQAFSCAGCPYRFDKSVLFDYLDRLPLSTDVEELTLHVEQLADVLWWE